MSASWISSHLFFSGCRSNDWPNLIELCINCVYLANSDPGWQAHWQKPAYEWRQCPSTQIATICQLASQDLLLKVAEDVLVPWAPVCNLGWLTKGSPPVRIFFLSGIARITSPPLPQFGQVVPLFLDVKNDFLARITEPRRPLYIWLYLTISVAGKLARTAYSENHLAVMSRWRTNRSFKSPLHYIGSHCNSDRARAPSINWVIFRG